ncbi:nitroreductase family protein [Lacrimispora sp. NSJ-141]|uniref:Nitroreductase family protein n=1 Tax=Lientehia hominis TaxID=2897778 RepID=A0AAP2RFV7_9FIRM|nr:nitroreductase family protein [Lientehia hominis]MCD2491447.1 nitroreductase family protein [Lientehia hominis]
MYEAVFNRKSVRHYKMEPLPQELFKNLRKFEQGLRPLWGKLRYSVELFNAMNGETRIKGLFKVKAPYYLVLFSEAGEYAMANAGYLMEQIVLYLTSKGIGTCYQGSAKIPAMDGPEGMEPMMVLAFGYADGKLYRDSFQAKRLPLKELCAFKEDSTEETRLMMQAARMAPSAMNGQPWRFMVYQNRIHVFAKKESFRFSSKADFLGFDIGVMLYHISLAAEENWRDTEFSRMEQMAAREFKNNKYFLTVLLV